MKFLAKATEAIRARVDFADLLTLAGIGLICYGCSLLHPAGLPISAGAAMVWIGVTA